jgi:hypothetical protein
VVRAVQIQKKQGEKVMIRTRIDKSGRWLVIKIPMQQPKASKSGNLVIASSRGVKTDEATFEGKQIWAVANAWLYPEDKPKKARRKSRS